MTVRLWFLPGVRVLRGLIVRSLEHPLILLAAADRNLGFVDIQPPRGIDVRDGEPSFFDQALAKAAEASGHPEVAYLPFLSKGTSAGVLGARNMGFWRPDRCTGVVHHAGGNLHHARRSPPRWMPHVPVLAINGEFERYGSEGGDHATWDDDMWWITAMFVRKAAKARIPEPEEPPTKEVLCVPLKPSDGWLSDSRLDHPRYEPAPYADYKGDKIEAFWHLDGEMAAAVAAYHEGEFYLPDLSLKRPADPGWGIVK